MIFKDIMGTLDIPISHKDILKDINKTRMIEVDRAMTVLAQHLT